MCLAAWHARTPSAELEFEEETDPSTFDDDATEAFDGIAEEIQKESWSPWEPSPAHVFRSLTCTISIRFYPFLFCTFRTAIFMQSESHQ